MKIKCTNMHTFVSVSRTRTGNFRAEGAKTPFFRLCE